MIENLKKYNTEKKSKLKKRKDLFFFK